MGRHDKMPVILGMDPPTKDVLFIKTTKPLEGYACMIFHADIPLGFKPGDHIELTNEEVKRKGLAAWIQFKNTEVMRKFGQELIDFANDAEVGNA